MTDQEKNLHLKTIATIVAIGLGILVSIMFPYVLLFAIVALLAFVFYMIVFECWIRHDRETRDAAHRRAARGE